MNDCKKRLNQIEVLNGTDRYLVQKESSPGGTVGISGASPSSPTSPISPCGPIGIQTPGSGCQEKLRAKHVEISSGFHGVIFTIINLNQ